MADSNSNSSSSSGSGSSGRPRTRRKISGDSKRSSQNSRTSDSASSLWQRKWLSNGDSIFDAQRNDLYECVDDDRETAAKAVAIVVNSTRKGVVSLCAEVAALLKAKKKLEIALAAQKKGLSSHGSNGPRLSNSSGSGSSLASKDKGTCTTKSSYKSLVHQGTSTLTSYSSFDSQHAAVQTEPVISSTPERDSKPVSDAACLNGKSNADCTSAQNLRDELKKALARNKQLEAELSVAKAGIQAPSKEHSALPQLTKPRELYGNKRVTVKNMTTKQSSPSPLETLNPDREFPHIALKTEQGHAHETNCKLKSCVKHRNKVISLRPFSSPLKIYPSARGDNPDTNRAVSFTRNQGFTVPINTLVSPENHFNKDKKLHFTKTEVLPKKGDHVAVNGEMKGIVKHIGPIQGELQTYVGLHLDSPVGNNNGTLNGVRYFCCPPNYGAFVPIEDVSVLSNKNSDRESMTLNRLPTPPREIPPVKTHTKSSTMPLSKSPIERQTIETAA